MSDSTNQSRFGKSSSQSFRPAEPIVRFKQATASEARWEKELEKSAKGPSGESRRLSGQTTEPRGKHRKRKAPGKGKGRMPGAAQCVSVCSSRLGYCAVANSFIFVVGNSRGANRTDFPAAPFLSSSSFVLAAAVTAACSSSSNSLAVILTLLAMTTSFL
jgi:hypothetical protein